jgi:RNA polymerase sigma-70 factor, ECF subfamily
MARYQAGDVDAFDRLYAGLAPTLRRYLSSQARDSAWADDLLQETFLQIHRARRTYDHACPVQPWAFAIARHVFLMGRRARVRKKDFDRAPVIDVEHLPVDAHDEAFLAKDGVRRGLAALTPGTRQAVVMRHIWGWSFKEIGARLGIRASAAKVRASRGMAALRGKLGAKKDDDGD